MKLAQTICLVALVAMSSTLVAQECKNCPASKTATVATSADQDSQCAGCKGTCDTACSTCIETAAMEKLPKMTYKVGTESTCCSHSAAEMAKKSEQPIHYVVADKTFDKESEAFVALVETTESFVKEFTTPAKCEVSGTTSVAGKSCACSVEAGQRTELVKAAITKVKMEYKVGEKTACCSATAAEMAKKSGEKMTFVVNGEATSCNQTARLNLARAQYIAAVKAIAAAEKPATTKPAATSTETASKGS